MADIGLHGAARRTETGLVPHYIVSLGGSTVEGRTRLATPSATIPAKNVPDFVLDLLRQSTQVTGADVRNYLAQEGHAVATSLSLRYRDPSAVERDSEIFSDWDSDVPYSLAGRGPGECSAGVFDLIEVDIVSARESLDAGKLYAATVSAARSLLVTRGEQPKTDLETLGLFQKHFVAEGLIDLGSAKVIDAATVNALVPNPEQGFAGSPTEVAALISSIKLLYEGMDASLRFKPLAPTVLATAAPAGAPAAKIDLRGVACPLNYVKTKMALAKLNSGQDLSVLLDGQGARNVPESAAKEGHTIVSSDSFGEYSQWVIRKV